jgi:hypothetical protein
MAKRPLLRRPCIVFPEIQQFGEQRGYQRGDIAEAGNRTT